MENVSVTLGMPVYNGANFIRDALESILAQTYRDFELIVTDNASTDETPQIVQEYIEKDDRVKYVLNAKNIGAAANYNKSYELAKGKYLKWCAHDDVLSPNFLEVCVDVLEKNPSVSLAFARTIGIDGEGEVVDATGDSTPPLIDDDPSVRFQKSIVLAGTCFPIFGLFRKEQLDRSTLHRPYYGSDRALLAEIATMGKFQRVDEVVFYNREHVQRSINIDDKLVRSQWQNGTSSRTASSEHINLTMHLLEIAGRHKDIISPWKMRRKLCAHALHPRQLGRYCLEIASVISPKITLFLRSKLLRRKQHT